MDRNQLFDNISSMVYCQENIMCCFPRRSGKTFLIERLLKEVLYDKEVLLIEPVLSMADCYRGSFKNLDIYSPHMSLDRLRGKQYDYVVLEEPTFIKPQRFIELLPVVSEIADKKIFMFTPCVYEGKNPHPVKVIWDSVPYYKFQLTGSDLPHYEEIVATKHTYSDEVWQTEVEGNWVAK